MKLLIKKISFLLIMIFSSNVSATCFDSLSDVYQSLKSRGLSTKILNEQMHKLVLNFELKDLGFPRIRLSEFKHREIKTIKDVVTKTHDELKGQWNNGLNSAAIKDLNAKLFKMGFYTESFLKKFTQKNFSKETIKYCKTLKIRNFEDIYDYLIQNKNKIWPINENVAKEINAFAIKNNFQIKVDFKQIFPSTKIKDLILTKDVYAFCKKEKIETVQDLSEYSEKDLIDAIEGDKYGVLMNKHQLKFDLMKNILELSQLQFAEISKHVTMSSSIIDLNLKKETVNELINSGFGDQILPWKIEKKPIEREYGIDERLKPIKYLIGFSTFTLKIRDKPISSSAIKDIQTQLAKIDLSLRKLTESEKKMVLYRSENFQEGQSFPRPPKNLFDVPLSETSLSKDIVDILLNSNFKTLRELKAYNENIDFKINTSFQLKDSDIATIKKEIKRAQKLLLKNE